MSVRDTIGPVPGELWKTLVSSLGQHVGSETDRCDDVITEIRRWDFSGHSDSELRIALERVKADLPDEGPEGRLPEVFAIVNEAVSRRLGAWRLFDTEFDCGDMAVFRDLANRILDDPTYRERRDAHTGQDFPDCDVFHEGIGALLTELGIGGEDGTILKTMVYVVEKGALAYQPEIMLPAEFYRSVESRDTDGSLRFRATDQQLVGALFLYKGRIVEMQSGEGKTVAAAFPAVLHAMSGRSVHVMTANDYLALRDAEWLAPVYESLGFTVFTVLDHMIDEERRTAYQGDVVYGTVREFGFDFLRDKLKYEKEEQVQGRRQVAIVDEADHAMVDDARTPLIISGKGASAFSGLHRIRGAVRDLVNLQSHEVAALEADALDAHGNDSQLHRLLATLLLAAPDCAELTSRLSRQPGLIRRLRSIVNGEELEDSRRSLTERLYYEFDESLQAVSLTARGQEYLGGRLGHLFETGDQGDRSDGLDAIASLSAAGRRRETDRRARIRHRRHRALNHVYQMLTAHVLMARDADYAVVDDAVIPIDDATGRLRPDSRYQHGLHPALEAKEGVSVQPEGETLAEITVRGYLKHYESLSGMTGTAAAARDELRCTYGLDVAVVPPSNRSIRADLPPRVYGSRSEKLLAALDDIKLCRRVGRPVLVAARTVEQSEELSALLDEQGIEHRTLNAVTTLDEPRVVREAGMARSVTIATNTAGRGTDIVLQPGLDGLVIDGYRRLVRDLLDEGRVVVLECPTSEDAGRMASALNDGPLPPGAPLTRTGDGRGIEAVPDQGPGRTTDRVHLKFGLGLHVIGTEINESVRSDLQLKGRSGRQGSSGSSQFLLSAEDELLRLNGTRLGRRSGVAADASGLTYVGGDAAVRHLERVQGMAERDVEMQRGVQSQFAQVLESHTLAYFGLREEVMAADSIHAECTRFAEDGARRLVDEFLPLAGMGKYDTAFDRLAENAWLDYRIDCSPLRGEGLGVMAARIGELLIDRLDYVRSIRGQDTSSRLEKLLYLQTADELWKSYLSRAEEMMSTARLCGHGLKGALADYVFRADEEFTLYRREVADMFLCSLLAFPLEAHAEEDGLEVPEDNELAAILV